MSRRIRHHALNPIFSIVAADLPIGRFVLLRNLGTSGTAVIDAIGTIPNSTLAGTQTNVRANRMRGIKYSGDNSIRIKQALLDAIMDPTTASGYHLVWASTIFINGDITTGNEWAFSVGAPTASTNVGGLGFRLATNSWPQAIWRAASDSSMTTLQATTTHTVGTERSYLADFDLTNPAAPALNFYVGGVINASNSSLSAGTGLPPLQATPGILVGARSADSSPYTGPTDWLGQRSGGETYMRSTLFGRIAQANASMIPTLAKQLASFPDELPLILTDL